MTIKVTGGVLEKNLVEVLAKAYQFLVVGTKRNSARRDLGATFFYERNILFRSWNKLMKYKVIYYYVIF